MPGRAATVCRLLVGALLYLLGESLYDEAGLSAGFAASAASAALLLLSVTLIHRTATAPAPPGRIRTAIRERALRTAFLPQRDPDAAGRARPRAPGHALPTAA
ncbi:DUF6412 domain-containing protein [Streptomyces sp. NPDC051940]|uniref:DUF6412 domain-containing protein n=1 Tax=Streptomyces sp. NPDC051940 TaxID=3155675 RepID=UPI0034416CD7